MTQSDPRRQLVGTLTRQDGIDLPNDDGKTWQQPGSAVLNVWLISMLKRTVVAVVPMPSDKWYSAGGYEITQNGPAGSLNISIGAKILYEAVQGDRPPIPQAVDLFTEKPQQEIVLAALEDTWEALSKRYNDNVSNWKAPTMVLTFRANNFFNVLQATTEGIHYQVEYQSRGIENDMTVFSSTASGRPVLAWDMVTPGQSGFIAPDGTVDKHYEDQLRMYENFGRKSLWLTKQDVEAHRESREMLHVQRQLSLNTLVF